jgi:hypothetical protein
MVAHGGGPLRTSHLIDLGLTSRLNISKGARDGHGERGKDDALPPTRNRLRSNMLS